MSGITLLLCAYCSLTNTCPEKLSRAGVKKIETTSIETKKDKVVIFELVELNLNLVKSH